MCHSRPLIFYMLKPRGCFDLVVLGGEWTGSFFASFLNQMTELPLVSVLSL